MLARGTAALRSLVLRRHRSPLPRPASIVSKQLRSSSAAGGNYYVGASALGAATRALDAGSSRPLKLHVFIDGTWLYYSLIQGRARSCPVQNKYGEAWHRRYRVDWSRLQQIVARHVHSQVLAQSYSNRAVEVVRASVFTSVRADTSQFSRRLLLINEWQKVRVGIKSLHIVLSIALNGMLKNRRTSRSTSSSPSTAARNAWTFLSLWRCCTWPRCRTRTTSRWSSQATRTFYPR